MLVRKSERAAPADSDDDAPPPPKVRKGAGLSGALSLRQQNEKRPRGRPSLKLSEAEQCQHPKAKYGERCKWPIVGEIDVPEDYNPGFVPRHGYQMPTERRIKVCHHHHFRITHWGEPKPKKGKFFSHQARCMVCANPRHQAIFKQWINMRITSAMAIAELDVSYQSFYNHINYFKLDEKRASKDSRVQFLLDRMEKGAAAGDDSVNTSLKASEQLTRLMGDAAEKHEHAHVATVLHGHVDLTKMGVDELTTLIAQLSDQLQSLTAGATQQLPANVGGLDTIDLPITSVRVLSDAGEDD